MKYINWRNRLAERIGEELVPERLKLEQAIDALGAELSRLLWSNGPSVTPLRATGETEGSEAL